jgi:hypothetical protein
MSRSKKINLFVLVLVFIVGVITPFVPAIHLVVMFVLIIPLFIGLVISLIALVVYLFMHGRNFFKSHTFWMPLVIPVYVICAMASGPLVNRIQRYRCERIIENISSRSNALPDSLDVRYGIKYIKGLDSGYSLEYSVGFFVREVYSSTDSTWERHGWRD